jgi:hypothetical protein
MHPAISYLGHPASHEVQDTQVMEKLGEALVGLNAVWIDVGSTEREGRVVRQMIIEKFHRTRNNGYPCYTITFDSHGKRYVTVSQFTQGEDFTSDPREYDSANVWARILQSLPDAQLKDGAICDVSKYEVEVFNRVLDVNKIGNKGEYMYVRRTTTDKLCWRMKGSRNGMRAERQRSIR